MHLSLIGLNMLLKFWRFLKNNYLYWIFQVIYIKKYPMRKNSIWCTEYFRPLKYTTPPSPPISPQQACNVMKTKDIYRCWCWYSSFTKSKILAHIQNNIHFLILVIMAKQDVKGVHIFLNLTDFPLMVSFLSGTWHLSTTFHEMGGLDFSSYLRSDKMVEEALRCFT